MVRLFTGTVGDMTALVIYSCNSCHSISSKHLKKQYQKLETDAMYEHLGVHKAVLNGLCNIDTDGTIKRSIYL